MRQRVTVGLDIKFQRCAVQEGPGKENFEVCETMKGKEGMEYAPPVLTKDMWLVVATAMSAEEEIGNFCGK